MASSTFKTIAVQFLKLFRKEAKAAGTITPGHLIQLDSNAEAVVHATAGGVLQGKLIALESQTPDDEDAWSIEINYVDNERVYYAVGQPGERYNMLLKAGENAALNAQLESAGDGSLQVESVGAGSLTNSIVGVAREAKDNSGGGTAVRILVEIV
jgi:hypothetical protein